MNKLDQVNRQIYEYWISCKNRLSLRPLSKNKVPSFTRHNGNRIKRLKDAWRAPKGNHGSKITCPKIGYKRPDHLRFRRKQDGLLFKVVNNKTQMDCELKPYQVIVFSSCLGARKRKIMLDYAKGNQVPVYISKRRSKL